MLAGLNININITVIILKDDETRVVLETDANNQRDFINASFINVSKVYIAHARMS